MVHRVWVPYRQQMQRSDSVCRVTAVQEGNAIATNDGRVAEAKQSCDSGAAAHAGSVKKSVKKMEVTFKVYRKEPGQGTQSGRSDYKLELGNDATVLDGLLKIRDEVDGT